MSGLGRNDYIDDIFQIELWVDDEEVANGVLPGNAYPARSGGLFLGGAVGMAAREKRIPDAAFKGTIADFIVDSE